MRPILLLLLSVLRAGEGGVQFKEEIISHVQPQFPSGVSLTAI